MSTTRHGAARQVALALWLGLGAYGLYSAWTCHEEAEALRAEVQRQRDDQQRALDGLRRRHRQELDQLQAGLDALERAAEDERGALARLEEDQRGLGERMKEVAAKTRRYKDALPATPEGLDECVALLSRAEQGFLSNARDYMTDRLDAPIQTCKEQIQALTGRYQEASGALDGLFGAVGEAATAFDDLQAGHFALLAQQDKKQRAEAEARDRATKIENTNKINSIEESAQEREVALARRQGWFDLLLARGFDAWWWWLHAGSLLVVLPLLGLVSLRLLHLWGVGRSLRLSGGGAR
jgi:chromosome segregation ATPase